MELKNSEIDIVVTSERKKKMPPIREPSRVKFSPQWSDETSVCMMGCHNSDPKRISGKHEELEGYQCLHDKDEHRIFWGVTRVENRKYSEQECTLDQVCRYIVRIYKSKFSPYWYFSAPSWSLVEIYIKLWPLYLFRARHAKRHEKLLIHAIDLYAPLEPDSDDEWVTLGSFPLKSEDKSVSMALTQLVASMYLYLSVQKVKVTVRIWNQSILNSS